MTTQTLTTKTRSRNTLLACIGVVASLAFAAPALAAGEGHIDGDTMGFMLSPNGGKYYMGKLKSTVMGELMKNAKPIPGGVVVFRSGGKYYMAEDPRGSYYRMQMDIAGGN